MKSILKNSLDRQPLEVPPDPPPPPGHDNIRGADYFDNGRSAMLTQPMMEKLTAMRLHGMVEALQSQQQDRAATETELCGAAGNAGRSAMELA